MLRSLVGSEMCIRDRKDGGIGGEGKKGYFQKFEILTASTPLQFQLAPPCQISCRSVKQFHTYGRLLNFSRWRLSAILGQNASSCIIVLNVVQIGQGVAEISRFRFFKMAAVRHLGFSKVRNFNCPHPSGRGKMRHHAKFCADGSNRCRDMAVFDFSRWRPSAILDFKKLEILTAHTLSLIHI